MLKLLTWIFRLLTGATFIFSGFVKAIDPWGTLYKFGEYAEALGFTPWHSILIAGVFGLCALEFLIGVMLVLGCYRRSVPIVALLFMAVMLPLTLWIAVSDPVADCGCFGDAFVISNWATFWKNVLLTVMIVWLMKFNRECMTIISPAFQWIGVVLTLAYIFVISFLGYKWQPLMDFRPYPTGTPLFADAEAGDDEEFVFIYEKDGEKKEFGIDDELPDENDGWRFVERKPVGKSGNGADEKTFRVWDRSGDEDLTDELMLGEGGELLLLIPDMNEVSPATTWKINALYDWTGANDVMMAAVVAGSAEKISAWADLAMPRYEIYTAEDTAIKEVARGNPAVVMVKNDTIVWKTALETLDVDALENKEAKIQPSVVVTDARSTLQNISWTYIICMMFPVALSFMPRLRNSYTVWRGKRKTDSNRQ